MGALKQIQYRAAKPKVHVSAPLDNAASYVVAWTQKKTKSFNRKKIAQLEFFQCDF